MTKFIISTWLAESSSASRKRASRFRKMKLNLLSERFLFWHVFSLSYLGFPRKRLNSQRGQHSKEEKNKMKTCENFYGNKFGFSTRAFFSSLLLTHKNHERTEFFYAVIRLNWNIFSINYVSVEDSWSCIKEKFIIRNSFLSFVV